MGSRWRYGCRPVAMWFVALWAGIVAAWADDVVADRVVAPGQYVEIKPMAEEGMHSFEISAALTGNRNSNGIGKASWGMEWCDTTGRVVRSLRIQWGNECLGDPVDRRFMRVTMDSIAPGGESHTLIARDFFDGVDLYGGFNTLSVDETETGEMLVWVGNDLEYSVGSCRVPEAPAMVKIGGNRKLKLRYAAYRFTPHPSVPLQTSWDEAGVMAYLANNGSGGIEGVWQFLDRDNDARWARPGGAYMLAVVRSRECNDMSNGVAPVYDILYLGGGKVNASAWRHGMLKGRLYPTIFENHYNLEWYDAYMEPLGEELSATVSEEGAVLTFDFPLHHSRMRFSRLPAR